MTEKSEALEAISQVRKILDAPEELTPVRRVILRGLLEYVEQVVGQIPTLKRARRAPKETS